VADGRGRLRSFDQQECELAYFENLLVAGLPPSHPDVQVRRCATRLRFQPASARRQRALLTRRAQMINAFADGTPPQRPWSLQSIQLGITYITTDEELPTQGRWEAVSGLTRLRGRGAGSPSVDKFIWAIKAYDNAFGHRSNADDPAVRMRVGKLRAEHICNSAQSYDVSEVRVLAFLGCAAAEPSDASTRCAAPAPPACAASAAVSRCNPSALVWRSRCLIRRSRGCAPPSSPTSSTASPTR